MSIFIEKLNESYVRINATETNIYHDLSDQFTFEAHNFQHHPKFKAGMWDGKIRMFDYRNQTLPFGLYKKVQKYAEENDIECNLNFSPALSDFSAIECEEFCKSLNLPFAPHQHQLDAIIYAIRNSRCILLSPTSSGKSLIFYVLCRFYLAQSHKKILLIVPNKNLVNQMFNDFTEYSGDSGWSVNDNCWKIMGGIEKESNTHSIYISTWQSLQKLPESYFHQFSVILGDEAHLYSSESLKKILSHAKKANIRIGATGTVNDVKANIMTLEGAFGVLHRTVTTKELMDNKKVADLTIKAFQLIHSLETEKFNSKDYETEKAFINNSPGRIKFIARLAMSLKGNVLILFTDIEPGKKIYEMLQHLNDGKKNIHYIDGKTPADKRTELQALMENIDGNNEILNASVGTSGTGMSIKNLMHVILTSAGKSEVQVLQNIGRSLRLHAAKSSVTVYDIFSDLRKGKKTLNHSMRHFNIRYGMYMREQFNVSVIPLNLKD